MSNLLYKYLERKGIKSREELSADEKATFQKWEKIFAKEIKVENIAEFVDEQIEKLQEQWLTLDEKEHSNMEFYWKEQLYIKARIKNLLAIKGLFNANVNNKKALELYLKDLLKK